MSQKIEEDLPFEHKGELRGSVKKRASCGTRSNRVSQDVSTEVVAASRALQGARLTRFPDGARRGRVKERKLPEIVQVGAELVVGCDVSLFLVLGNPHQLTGNRVPSVGGRPSAELRADVFRNEDVRRNTDGHRNEWDRSDVASQERLEDRAVRTSDVERRDEDRRARKLVLAHLAHDPFGLLDGVFGVLLDVNTTATPQVEGLFLEHLDRERPRRRFSLVVASDEEMTCRDALLFPRIDGLPDAPPLAEARHSDDRVHAVLHMRDREDHRDHLGDFHRLVSLYDTGNSHGAPPSV